MPSTSSDNYFSHEHEAGAGCRPWSPRSNWGDEGGGRPGTGRMIDERRAGPLDAVLAADNVDVVDDDDDERRRGG